MEQKCMIILGVGIAGLWVKVIVVYESKYGNTKLLAETIAGRMTEVEGMEAVVSEGKEVDLGKVPDYDAILVGPPNHSETGNSRLVNQS
jgi:menaquinone-dependent protoporphyrinogen IX oxidase